MNVFRSTKTASRQLLRRHAQWRNEPILTAALAFLVVTMTCRLTCATLVVDREVDRLGSSVPYNPVIDEFQFVLQTFTAGVGGSLAAVDVQVKQGPDGVPASDLVLTLRNTLATGEPNRTQDLGSVSLPAGNIPAFDNYISRPFTTFDVSGLNVSVSPGDVLAFELSSAAEMNGT